MTRQIQIALCAFAALLAGCSESTDRTLTQYAAPGRSAFAADDKPRPEQPEILEPSGELSLQNALALALLHNPQLRSYAIDVRIAEANRLQASLRPNPELGFEAEQLGAEGRGALQSGDTIIALSHLIELGGKRQKRTRLGDLDTRLAGMDYEARRLDVLTEVHNRFVDVLAAQRKVDLTQSLEHLAAEALRIVEEQVRTGRDSPLEINRAQVQVADVRIERIAAQRNLQVARKALVSLWSADEARFETAVGDLEATPAVAPAARLTEQIDRNPDLARWTVELEQRRAAIALEKARAIPDVTLGSGIQILDRPSETATVFGARIALPIFDTNQGNRRAAAHRLARADLESRAARLRVETDLLSAHSNVANALTTIDELRDTVLPNSLRVFQAKEEGYRAGRFDYIDLLDAQRTYFDARVRYLAALTDYHKAKAELERLIGGPADDHQIAAEEN